MARFGGIEPFPGSMRGIFGRPMLKRICEASRAVINHIMPKRGRGFWSMLRFGAGGGDSPFL